MTKKSDTPQMSRRELNNMLGATNIYRETNNDTDSTSEVDDGERKTTPKPPAESVREVVNIGSATSMPTVPTSSEIPTAPTVPTAPYALNAPTSLPQPEASRRPTAKQRKASFDEYRDTFLQAPKITDRKPVFVSCSTRDRLDEIVRKLGDRRMSVSGLLENIALEHLTAYADDIDIWKRL